MRNRFIILLIALLNFFGSAAYAGAGSGAQQPPRGTLYRVTGEGHTTYLFGTIHVGRPEFYPLEARASKAIADASVIAMELDMRDTSGLQQAAMTHGIFANGDTLDQHISKAVLTRLQDALGKLGMPYAIISHMKAWMAANTIVVLQLEKQGYHADLATENYLTKAAEDAHKTIVGLETADFQLGLFDSMTEKQQEQYLVDNLDEMDSGEADKKTKELLDAWANADEKTFADLLKEAESDQTEAGKFFMDELIGKRNPEMANKVAQMLKDDKSSFVAVGLLHLVGANGVPQLLAKRGYEVKRIY